VDVVSYGRRPEPAQARVRDRLRGLLRQVVADVVITAGADVDEVDHDSGTGDGTVVFLAARGAAPSLLPVLLGSAAERLAADNAASQDRIRLRMAVGSGPVGAGGGGVTGPLVVNVSRLVDSEPLRRAVREHPEADLVVLVLDMPSGQVAGPGYVPLSSDRFPVVDLALRELTGPGRLWASAPQGR
jgi:hypothetical protein